MRRVFLAPVLALGLATAGVALTPDVADAQAQPRGRTGGQNGSGQNADGSEAQERTRAPRLAPLRRQPNAGPCPYVKILYDAARYVELADNRPATANIGFTGEIEGLSSACAYASDEPIRVEMNILFNLGRGVRATDTSRTYRYWIAVTARDNAVLAKEYFDLPVDFGDSDRTSVVEERTIMIPRAGAQTSGGNFEVLVGFDVTPEMADFNRSGSRFRINAGQTQAAAPAPAQQ